MATIVEFDESKKKFRSVAMVARASVRSRVPFSTRFLPGAFMAHYFS